MGERVDGEEVRASEGAEQVYTPPRPSRISRVVLLVLVGGMWWLAWAFGSDAWEHAQLVRRAETFVPVSAKIERVATHQEGKNYVPELRFSYTYKGERHIGTNRHEAIAFRDAKLARQAIQDRRRGEVVQVFVDPHRPERAVMRRNISALWGLGRGAFAFVLVLASIFVLLMARRADKKAAAMAYSRYLQDRPR